MNEKMTWRYIFRAYGGARQVDYVHCCVDSFIPNDIWPDGLHRMPAPLIAVGPNTGCPVRLDTVDALMGGEDDFDKVMAETITLGIGVIPPMVVDGAPAYPDDVKRNILKTALDAVMAEGIKYLFCIIVLVDADAVHVVARGAKG